MITGVEERFRRYERQIIVPEIGVEGQKKLMRAKVLLIGLGGLGSAAAYYLAAAGVGTLGLLDYDRVESSNLQRQILHSVADLGRAKVRSAADRLKMLNPDLDIVEYPQKLVPSNAKDIIRGYHVVLDCTDNISAHLLVNDACYLIRRPMVSGAVLNFLGHVTTFKAWETGPCYRCLFAWPELFAKRNGETRGVVGCAPGAIGAIQAAEAIKLILNIGIPLIGRMLEIDLLNGEATEIEFTKNPGCKLCGENPVITSLG